MESELQNKVHVCERVSGRAECEPANQRPLRAALCVKSGLSLCFLTRMFDWVKHRMQHITETSTDQASNLNKNDLTKIYSRAQP